MTKILRARHFLNVSRETIVEIMDFRKKKRYFARKEPFVRRIILEFTTIYPIIPCSEGKSGIKNAECRIGDPIIEFPNVSRETLTLTYLFDCWLAKNDRKLYF